MAWRLFSDKLLVSPGLLSHKMCHWKFICIWKNLSLACLPFLCSVINESKFFWSVTPTLDLIYFSRWNMFCIVYTFVVGSRADSRSVPSQWGLSLQSNVISHWLGANLESALGVNELTICPLGMVFSLMLSGLFCHISLHGFLVLNSPYC